MTARRLFTALGVIAVAAVAGGISYRHQQHLAATHGQPHGLSLIWPLCVDGLVTVTALAISTDRAAGLRPRPWALVGFWVGVVVSVVTNWLATSGGLINHGVSAFPALAFLLAVESLSSKPRAPKTAPAMASPETVNAAEFAAVAVNAVTVKNAPETEPMAEPTTERMTPLRPSRKAPRSVTAAAKVASAARKLPGASAAQIAAKAGVSESTARRHLGASKVPPVASSSMQAPAGMNGRDFARLTS
jgi:hypothetical protein